MKHARDDYNRIQDPAGLIPDDEPVFLLRGQDVLAPRILRAYAGVARLAGLPEIAAKTDAQADAMEHWQSNVAKKTPDL